MELVDILVLETSAVMACRFEACQRYQNLVIMLYCIEVKRGGIGEEDLVMHQNFPQEPTREEILNFISECDVGYDDDYCKFEYYPVG